MEQSIGRVKEVFIPVRNEIIDIMDSNEIGFKIEIDGVLEEFIFEQDEINSDIMKDDLVVITKQKISDVYFIDIELYEGEDYE